MSTETSQSIPESLLRVVFQQAQDGIFVFDERACVVEANPMACQMLGYTRQELQGLSLAQLIMSDHLQSYPLRLEELRKKSVLRMERRMRRKDGTSLAVEVSAYGTPDGQLIGFVREVTERQQAEEAIRTSEARFRALVDAAAQIVWTTGAQGDVVEDSPSWRAFTGQSYEAWKGFGWLEVLHPDDRERVAGEWQRAVDSRSPLATEYRLWHHSGEWRWTAVRASPVYSPHGELEAWVGMNTDITERKQIEQALADEQERRQLALEAGRMGTWHWYPASKTVEVDVSLRRMFGLSPDESTTSEDRIFQTFHRDDLPETRRRLENALQQRGTYEHDFRVILLDGSVRWCRSIGRGYYDAAGQFVVFNGVIFDIHAHKEAEQALHQSEDRLQQVISHLSEGLVIADTSGKMLHWNRAALAMHGFANMEECRQTLPEFQDLYQLAFLDGTPVPYDQWPMMRLFRDEEVQELELRIRRLDSDWERVFRYGGSSFLDATQQQVVFLSITDVTERNAAEQALKASEQRFERIVRATNDAVWDWDFATDDIWWNDGLRTIFGHDLKELKSDIAWWEEHIHSDDRLWLIDDLQNAIDNGEISWSGEYRYARADGTYAWVLDRGYIERDDDGRAVRMVGGMADITVRKEMEESIRNSEERFSKVFRMSPAAKALVRNEGREIMDANESYARLVGIRREELLGQSAAELLIVEAAERALIRDRMMANRGVIHNMEITATSREGKKLDVLFSAEPLELAGEACILVTMIDISRQKQAERQITQLHSDLAKSEKRFRGLVENSKDLFLVSTPAGMQYVSDNVVQILGYTPEAYLQLLPEQLVHPDDQPLRWKELEQPNALITLKFRALHQDGHWVWMEGTASNLFHVEEVGGILFTLRDITEKKHAEDALRESELHFRQLTESLPQLVWTCRPDGTCDYLSQQWVEYTGMPAEIQLQIGWMEQVHPDDRDATIDAWHLAVTQKSDFHVEFRIRRHDGLYRWFDTRAVRLVDSAGDTVKWFGSNTDIHDRREAEQALHLMNELLEQRVKERTIQLAEANQDLHAFAEEMQATNEELHTANEHISAINRQLTETTDLLQEAQHAASLGNWVIEIPSMKLFWSRELYEIWGFDTSETPRLAWVEERMHPEDFARLQESLDWNIREKKPSESIFRIFHPDGQMRFIETKAFPIVDDTGNVVRLRGISQDITLRKRLEEDLQQINASLEQKVNQRTTELRQLARTLQARNEELMRTNADLDNFIYMSSHDLKHPITNLEGLIDTLQFFQEPGQMERWEEMMRLSVARLRKVITHITEIAKVQKGLESEVKELDIAQVVQEVEKDLQALMTQEDATIQLQLDVPTVTFIPKYFNSILQNLLSNAIKYHHPERKPVVHLSTHREKERIVLTVRDNGLGLSPSQQKRLFKMFQRLHTHVEGTGIGLYMIKRMVENYGGRITAESQVDQGTTFRVYFNPTWFERPPHHTT
ncbi:PAS domain S-box-containing protein [Catalinimonas alkaloidigena]|uniref:histidine kinase n=1 Tax=Catalinimonas alkaloidigena TaxID=1075417 RepID=A0A1G9NZJ3_9BACT|nr:PAS domain S-box protein [Catalinimonas alkaloidigena]SDL91395.1 PAS domain S-box-containing protein [Catalinimonas alkaloidigena]